MSNYANACTYICVEYYSETNEADAWMNEKAGIASSQDYGRDEDDATKALTKHKDCSPTIEVSVRPSV